MLDLRGRPEGFRRPGPVLGSLKGEDESTGDTDLQQISIRILIKLPIINNYSLMSDDGEGVL